MKANILVIAILLCISCVCAEDTSTYTFEDFISQFNRKYPTNEELEFRRTVFEANYLKIQEEEKRANGTYHVTVNNFTDWTDEQKKRFFPYLQTNSKVKSVRPKLSSTRVTYAASLDYRANGKVTSVKDQSSCGSCWAFSTTAQYESLFLIKTNVEYDLAEQYVLDCTSAGSCATGGLPYDALFVINGTGIPQESSYAYKPIDDYYGPGICSAPNKKKLPNFVSAIYHYDSVTEGQLKQILTDYGPVSVGVRAHDGFVAYSSGIFSGCPSNSTHTQGINHAVLLVGYTIEGHWIIKNSWGPTWGEQGYMTIHKDNDCELRTYVDVMVTNSSNPKQLKYTVNLQDTYGDGWSGLSIGVRQNGKVISTFGENFNEGSSQGPIEIQVQENVLAELVVVQMAEWVNEISFTLHDETGKIIYTRNPGSFSPSIIFKSWCPGTNCSALNFPVFITLTDTYGDGWSGSVLAFKQNNQVVATFGADFKTGHNFGPIEVNLSRYTLASIVVSKFGDFREECGFIIRDSIGVVMLERKSGVSFTSTQTLGTICPGCLNYSPPREALASGRTKASERPEVKPSSSQTQAQQPQPQSQPLPTSDGQNSDLIVSVSILGFFTLFFMIATVFLFFSLRKQRNDKNAGFLSETASNHNEHEDHINKRSKINEEFGTAQ